MDDDLPVMCDIDSLQEDAEREILTKEGRKFMNKKEAQKMSKFPLENILKVSLYTYLESVGKEVSDYGLVGIHTKGYELGSLTQIFQTQVPTDAEKVVDYDVLPHRDGSGCGTAYGTALIPKYEEKPRPVPIDTSTRCLSKFDFDPSGLAGKKEDDLSSALKKIDVDLVGFAKNQNKREE